MAWYEYPNNFTLNGQSGNSVDGIGNFILYLNSQTDGLIALIMMILPGFIVALYSMSRDDDFTSASIYGFVVSILVGIPLVILGLINFAWILVAIIGAIALALISSNKNRWV